MAPILSRRLARILAAALVVAVSAVLAVFDALVAFAMAVFQEGFFLGMKINGPLVVVVVSLPSALLALAEARAVVETLRGRLERGRRLVSMAALGHLAFSVLYVRPFSPYELAAATMLAIAWLVARLAPAVGADAAVAA